MSIIPAGCIEVIYQGITYIRGDEKNISIILLKDERERSMAVPLQDLEVELIHRSLQDIDEEFQPYRLLLTCLKELGMALHSIRILNTPDFDLSTQLILHWKGYPDVKVIASCSEAVACAVIAKVPIYVEEELMKAISTSTPNAETNCREVK